MERAKIGMEKHLPQPLGVPLITLSAKPCTKAIKI